MLQSRSLRRWQGVANVGNSGYGGSHEVHPYAPFTWKDIERVTEAAKLIVSADRAKFDEQYGGTFEG